MKVNFSIVFLVLAVIGYRLAVASAGADLGSQLANFTPLVALAVLVGQTLKRPAAVSLVLSLTLFSDILVAVVKKSDVHVGYSLAFALLNTAFAFAGPYLRRHFSFQNSLLAVGGGVVLFHLAANTLSFALDPGYAKSAAGWIQAQTVGLPAYPPAYLFLLKSLVGNLGFAFVFLLTCGQPSKLAALSPSDANPIHV